MGIRIKKMLGYGLTDVKYDKEEDKIIDDRFNPLGYLLSDWEDQEEIWTRDGWIKFADNHIEEYDLHMHNRFFNNFKPLKSWEPYDSIVYDEEFGDEKVFLIIPPEHAYRTGEGWIRNDNIIDYHEEYILNKDGGAPRHHFVDGGIWPYQSSYDNKKTGKRLDRNAHEWRYDYRLVNKDLIDFRTIHMMWQFLDKFAKKMGFDGYLDAEENIVPMIPGEVKAFCEWLNLFNDESTIWELKPLLYIYWS
jgi:hypothetical protein